MEFGYSMDMSENMFVQMYEENEFFWCITSGMVSLGDNSIKFLVAKISDIDLRALLTLTKASFQIPPNNCHLGQYFCTSVCV